jgi:hypothetical protein
MPIIAEQWFFHGLSRVKFWRGGLYWVPPPLRLKHFYIW